MKKRNLILALSLTASLVGITGVGVTLAAYTASAEIAQYVGSFGYKKASVFLDVSADLGNGETWAKDGALFYLWAWAGDGGSAESQPTLTNP